MADKKKLTEKQRERILVRYAKDYEYLVQRLWDAQLNNVARRLGEEPEDLHEEFGALT